MIINVKNSTMVRPAEEMPKRSLWLSNVDLLMPSVHTPYVYFYRSNGSPDFFDPNLIKEALKKVLVPFYPVAGRLDKDKINGRVEIDCNGQGVLFVEAQTTLVLDDLDHFASMLELQSLIPTVDYSGGISSYPLLVIQHTYFKCGGVSLGVGINHLAADGLASTHMINTWAEIARGLNPSIPPIHDRTLLRARDRTQPKSDHIENHHSHLNLMTTDHPQQDTISVRLFNMTSGQINALKPMSSNQGGPTYTTNDVLSGHIWRCACKARGLGLGSVNNQPTSLLIAVDARSRLQPNLPQGYFGNGVFSPCAVSGAGDLVSKPSWYAASMVHEVVTRMDDDYLRSGIDYLELQPDVVVHRLNNIQGPSLAITSWRWFKMYESDFGSGPPVFAGYAGIPCEGIVCILPCPVNDGSMSFVVSLQVQHMKLFETCLYDI